GHEVLQLREPSQLCLGEALEERVHVRRDVLVLQAQRLQPAGDRSLVGLRRELLSLRGLIDHVREGCDRPLPALELVRRELCLSHRTPPLSVVSATYVTPFPSRCQA